MTTKCRFALLVIGTIGVWASIANATECQVLNFQTNDVPHSKAWGGSVSSTGSVAINITNSIERCAQVRIGCKGYGSQIIDADEMTASFADGKSRVGARTAFESFRLEGGQSKTAYVCFGESDAPIVRINGRF